jgi:hypothetical protein
LNFLQVLLSWSVAPEQPESNKVEAHFVWQYFRGRARNALCIFYGTMLSGCSTSRAAAPLLARPIMGQMKAGILPYIAINIKDDDRRRALKTL